MSPRARGGAARLIDPAGIADDRKGWLFRTSRGHAATALSDQPMTQPDAWRMMGSSALSPEARLGIGIGLGFWKILHSFKR
jgi:hypothetical protein